MEGGNWFNAVFLLERAEGSSFLWSSGLHGDVSGLSLIVKLFALMFVGNGVDY